RERRWAPPRMADATPPSSPNYVNHLRKSVATRPRHFLHEVDEMLQPLDASSSWAGSTPGASRSSNSYCHAGSTGFQGIDATLSLRSSRVEGEVKMCTSSRGAARR